MTPPSSPARPSTWTVAASAVEPAPGFLRLTADCFVILTPVRRGADSMIGKVVRACALALVVAVPTIGGASAGSVYDGSWALTIATQRGACDPSYNFQVQITNGVVSHPNLVRLKGRVVSGGHVRVSVAVPG